MKSLLDRSNRRNLCRIIWPLLFLVLCVWARANIVENIKPYEFLWCMWVLSTVVGGIGVGWVGNDIWHTCVVCKDERTDK